MSPGLENISSTFWDKLDLLSRNIDEFDKNENVLDNRFSFNFQLQQHSLVNNYLKNIKRYLLSIEERYISNTDGIQLKSKLEIHNHTSDIIFYPSCFSNFLCINDRLFYFTEETIVYYKSDYIKVINDNVSLKCIINCKYSGDPVSFWVFIKVPGKKENKIKFDLNNYQQCIEFKIPKDATEYAFSLRLIGKGALQLKSLEVTESNKSDFGSICTILPLPPRSLKTLKYAYILDELSESCLKYEANAIPLIKNRHEEILKEQKPDFVLIESCWRGNNKTYGAFNEKNFGIKKLQPILKLCNSLNIPTVFWNKEDPYHYEGFKNIANLFDYIFTTDANMLPRYKKDTGRDAGYLPFAAQPVLHNPGSGMDKNRKAFFAGSWYGEKQERCNDFMQLAHFLDRNGLEFDIYDRCLPLKMDRYKWPENLQTRILGYLEPEDVFAQTRKYKFQMNVNTVKDSPTMFSRRVFESLACGTPIIGNPAQGISRTFGDLTVTTDDDEYLNSLLNNDKLYEDVRQRGILEVMRNHTYAKRFLKICRALNLNFQETIPSIQLVGIADTEEEAREYEKAFEKQSWQNKYLVVFIRHFEGYYHYLNKNSERKIFVPLPVQNNNPVSPIETDFKYICNKDEKLADIALEIFVYNHYSDLVKNHE